MEGNRECGSRVENPHSRKRPKTTWERAPQIAVGESMGLRMASLSAVEMVPR